jgi:hypothetical protein
MADRFLDDLEFTGDRTIPENPCLDHVLFRIDNRSRQGSFRDRVYEGNVGLFGDCQLFFLFFVISRNDAKENTIGIQRSYA